MTASQWIQNATDQLSKAGIDTARLDSLVLLEDVTGKDRGWLLANPAHEVTAADRAKLTKLLSQRAEHTPLAYVRGKTEFYGRDFVITPAVLVPRPESETMIDLLGRLSATSRLWSEKSENGSHTLKIADIGTGSGALGITAKLEFPTDKKVVVDLLEIDSQAIKIAKTNVEKHTTTINVIESDLLTNSSRDYDVLLCNLPYVPDDHPVNKAALQEPGIALFGGPDGLDLYRSLFKQIDKLKKRPLYILTESLSLQHDDLAGIAKPRGYQLEQTDDFIQVFRKTQQ